MTWIRLWPFTLVPLLIMVVIGLFPELALGKLVISGGAIRQWFLNTLFLPPLPVAHQIDVVAWFNRASVSDEIALHSFISLNLWAFTFPLYYLFIEVLIAFNSWVSSTELKQKRSALNRH